MPGYTYFVEGDADTVIDRFSQLPEQIKKYRLIVTSPPYYKHRKYGNDVREMGREASDCTFVERLIMLFVRCRRLLRDDGSLWVVIGDARRNYGKLLIPHRLTAGLVKEGYILREDIIWYKRNYLASGSQINFSQAYEYVLFFSKRSNCFTNMDLIRSKGNEAREGRNKEPPLNMLQFSPIRPDKKKIALIMEKIANWSSAPTTEILPSTSEIARAYGYDPEKYCPTCYRKFKRHATRNRIGEHKHYPIFAVCNSRGKNPGNVWDIATKAHHGNEHFAIFPEELVERIVKYATLKGDWVLDPFSGRGTTGIICKKLKRRFVGIDLYPNNISLSRKNVQNAPACNSE
jgi:site-specific DNA-methyltransferase (adenine-specific)